jgi:hypothetical protein
MRRTMASSVLFYCLALSVSFGGVVHSTDAVAEERVVGVVVDYKPRSRGSEEALISIERNGKRIPVKEHEILYEGDRLVFAETAGPDAYVKALVGAHKKIILDPAHSAVPGASWPFLQSMVPKLIAAYRWVNAAAGDDNSEPRNAVSRGALDESEDLTVLPKAHDILVISNTDQSPLWFGWTGGTPPFKVSITENGKVRQEIDVCKDGSEDGCVREVMLVGTVEADRPITLSILSSDNSSWSRDVKSAALAEDNDLSASKKLGSLGVFLHATELLDRDAGTYVLESARELATISSDYPPARTLLDEIKSGQVP